MTEAYLHMFLLLLSLFRPLDFLRFADDQLLHRASLLLGIRRTARPSAVEYLVAEMAEIISDA